MILNVMKCSNCSKQAKIKYIDKKLCSACFCKIVERKIKQEFKNYGVVKDEKLSVSDDAVEWCLTEVIKLPLKLGEVGRRVIAWTVDDEIEEFLVAMFESKKLKVGKEIKLFKQLSKKDVEEYMKIKKIDYSFERTELNSKIDKINNKYPQTKNSLLKIIAKVKVL